MKRVWRLGDAESAARRILAGFFLSPLVPMSLQITHEMCESSSDLLASAWVFAAVLNPLSLLPGWSKELP